MPQTFFKRQPIHPRYLVAAGTGWAHGLVAGAGNTDLRPLVDARTGPGGLGFVLAAVGIAIAGCMAIILPENVRSQATGEPRWIEDIPRWMDAEACNGPTEKDRARDQKALQIFADFNNQKGGERWN